ncbi:DUF4167 domain-containing protein [Nereida sp. MMG025]|uniref:DUF4167 domain-containing protein n=1 Tax=Nereida sp. MMG025 TaxID=2909981 RepID=UPI001F2D7DFC|nr:DUF4167 domain-containing protein [Nereida sp. MMG025]MCF6443449.1 DUF4167 domain-containing protein [Nereida sp. MMG025]
MRSSKNRSRNKNRNNNRPSGGNIINRVFDSSGPEGKVRGTPQQIIDKYNQLARDAQLSGDRVAVEAFQQHAEHYTRILGEAQREVDAKREEQERQNRERQEQRDRERAERQERESNGSGEQAQAAEEGGLVETPEAKADAPEAEAKAEKPKRARRPRKPKAETQDPADAPAEAPAPDAAE